jgi:hypothetical protein
MNRVSAPGMPSIDRLEPVVRSRSITASKCISKLAWSLPPSESPNPHDHGLLVYLETRLIMACKAAPLWPPSAFPISLDYNLRVHFQLYSFTASRCICKRAQSHPPSEPPYSSDCGLQVCMITASKCNSKLVPSWPRSVSVSSLEHDFLAHHQLLSSTTYRHWRYALYRWVTIYIHRCKYKLTTWVLKIAER